MPSSRVLLVACGEPSIRAALDRFEAEGFEGQLVERVLLPGGCWWLAEAANASSGRLKRLVAGRIAALEAVASMLDSPGIVQIALVGHQECGWYREHSPRISPGELIKRLGTDIYTARDELRRVANTSPPIRGVVLIRTPEGAWQPRELFA